MLRLVRRKNGRCIMRDNGSFYMEMAKKRFNTLRDSPEGGKVGALFQDYRYITLGCDLILSRVNPKDIETLIETGHLGGYKIKKNGRVIFGIHLESHFQGLRGVEEGKRVDALCEWYTGLRAVLMVEGIKKEQLEELFKRAYEVR